MTCQNHQQPERTDFAERAQGVLKQSVDAFSFALEVDERHRQLPHYDPEFDATSRVATKLREIGDILAELHEDLVRRAEQAEQPVRVSA